MDLCNQLCKSTEEEGKKFRNKCAHIKKWTTHLCTVTFKTSRKWVKRVARKLAICRSWRTSLTNLKLSPMSMKREGWRSATRAIDKTEMAVTEKSSRDQGGRRCENLKQFLVEHGLCNKIEWTRMFEIGTGLPIKNNVVKPSLQHRTYENTKHCCVHATPDDPRRCPWRPCGCTWENWKLFLFVRSRSIHGV